MGGAIAGSARRTDRPERSGNGGSYSATHSLNCFELISESFVWIGGRTKRTRLQGRRIFTGEFGYHRGTERLSDVDGGVAPSMGHGFPNGKTEVGRDT